MIRSNQSVTYPIALLLSISTKKNFESLGRYFEISGDTISRILATDAVTMHDLIAFCKTIFKEKSLYLLIDDTLITKIYSRVIEGTCDNYDSSNKVSKRSFCSVVAMLSDGKTAIPITQELWISLEFKPLVYQKKWEIAQELISKIRPLVRIKMVVMDGLYAIVAFIKWLNQNQINFEMRFHANRAILYKGIKGQIKKHPRFKINGKNPKRTAKIIWNNITLHATGFRRLMKNGRFSIVFQIANYKASANQHIQTYLYRWNIEKFFRTAKQKLGLNDCMARTQETQENHIMNVFLAYAFAQKERLRLKLKNVEMAIKSIQRTNPDKLYRRLYRFREIFAHA